MKGTIERSVELDLPARAAYDQFTQFEDFPRFLGWIESAEQTDERHVRWKARLGGKTHECETEICEQIPDKRIAWKAISGPWNAGVVTFHRLSEERSKVMLQLEYEPEGFVATVGEKLGLTARRLESELESFKNFLEARGAPTGAWRGEIPSPDER